MKTTAIFLLLFLAGLLLSAQNGSVTNVQVSQRSDGSGLVDVWFDLAGTSTAYNLYLRVSFNDGDTYFPISANSVTGDTGPVNPGNNKHIVWNPAIDHPNRYSPQTRVGVVAYLLGSQNPCPGTPTVTDYDGNVYNTVQIGEQCWMKENLNSVRNASGISINRYCYGNDNTNCELYGGLYNWSTIMNGSPASSSNPSGVQGICPTGWHVPSDGEWTQLTNYLISTYLDINSGNVGNKLKSCRQISSPVGGACSTSVHPRWTNHSTQYGTNDFGFTALPGGHIYSGNNYYKIGNASFFWSTTANTSTSSYYREINYDKGTVDRYYYPNSSYYQGLRCVKN